MKAKRRGLIANASRTPPVRLIRPVAGLPSPRPRAPKSGSSTAPASSSASAAPPSSTPPSSVSSPGTASFALDVLGGRPVDLEVDLGRGLVLANPIVAASGPFGYGVEVADLADLARLGALVTRGTSLKPRPGHPAPRIAEVPAGLLIGVGPQNPGLEIVLDRFAGTWASWAVPVILNLCADSAGELGDAVRRLEGVPGVAGIEINLSCGGGGRGGSVPGLDPTAAGSYVAAARRATDLPVIAKLTAAAPDVRAVAQACEDAGADAISAINTLPGLALAADRRGPALGSDYGGLCGPALRPIALRVVWEVAQAVDVPVIGIGGVAALEDVLDMLAVGATAVGIGVAALADPMLPVRLADELADACRAAGVGAARDLVGTALPARAAAPSTRGAEYAR
jgi:dihydroorotate dehydrogenase (NAD+) catalytic subunit